MQSKNKNIKTIDSETSKVGESSRGPGGGRGNKFIDNSSIPVKRAPSLQMKALANLSLSHTEFSVIMGGLLGDGSLKLYAGYKNARYSFRHSTRQANYFYSKCSLLSTISSANCIFEQPADGFSKLPKLRYQSKALEPLTSIWAQTHKKNQLVIRRRWLNHLTPLSLAIWWFDDGSIVGGGRQGCLCTDGFTEGECNILARYLLVVWGVRARVGPVRRSRGTVYFRLWLSTNQLKSFLDIILPHLTHAEMVYKCIIHYKSNALQQRWISHILNKSPPHLRHDAVCIIEERCRGVRE